MEINNAPAFDAVDNLVVDNLFTVTAVVETTVVDVLNITANAQNLTVDQTFDLSNNGISANAAIIQTSGDTLMSEVDTVDDINGIETDTGAVEVTSTLVTKTAQANIDEDVSIEPAVRDNTQLADTVKLASSSSLDESTTIEHPHFDINLRNALSEEAAIARVLGATLTDIHNCDNFFLDDADFGTSDAAAAPKGKFFLNEDFSAVELLDSNPSNASETGQNLSVADASMVSTVPDVPGAPVQDFDTSADDSDDLPEFPSARKEALVTSNTAQIGKGTTQIESLVVGQDGPTFLSTFATNAALIATSGQESLVPAITNSPFNSYLSGGQPFYAAPSAPNKDPWAIYNWTSVNSAPNTSNAQVPSLKRELANPVTPAAKKQVVKKSQLVLSSCDTPQSSPTTATLSAPFALNAPVGSNGRTAGGIDFDLTNHPYHSHCGAHLPGPNPLIPALRSLQGTVYIHTLARFVKKGNNHINKDPVNAKAMLTKPVKNYIPIVCVNSDGVHNEPAASQQSAAPDAAGKVTFYWPCREDSYQAISWKKTLGRDLALACEAHMPTEYILKGFPTDYVLWEKISGKVDANNTISSVDRTDRYLYGFRGGKGKQGRGKYASPQEFFPHLLWLGTNINGEYECTCHLCDKGLEAERVRRKAEMGVHDRVQFAVEKWNDQHKAIIEAKEEKNKAAGGGGY